MSGRGGAGPAKLALVEGGVGAVVAPLGRLLMVLRFAIAGEKIVGIEAIADPERLRRLDVTPLED
jgi:hypothetical protein